MKRFSCMILVLLVSISLFAGGAQESAEEFKVGFVFTGPIGDNGWTQQHNTARLAIESELGVKTLYKESVPNTQESEKVMRDMIAQARR